MSDKGKFVTFVRRGIKPMAIHRKAASATKPALAGLVGIARWFTCGRQYHRAVLQGRIILLKQKMSKRKTNLPANPFRQMDNPYTLSPHGRKHPCYPYQDGFSRLVRFSGLRTNSPTVYLIVGRIKCYIEIW